MSGERARRYRLLFDTWYFLDTPAIRTSLPRLVCFDSSKARGRYPLTTLRVCIHYSSRTLDKRTTGYYPACSVYQTYHRLLLIEQCAQTLNSIPVLHRAHAVRERTGNVFPEGVHLKIDGLQAALSCHIGCGPICPNIPCAKHHVCQIFLLRSAITHRSIASYPAIRAGGVKIRQQQKHGNRKILGPSPSKGPCRQSLRHKATARCLRRLVL